MSEKILATDLDGTLFFPSFPSRFVSRKNRRAVRRWVEAGNRLVLVTSRYTNIKEKLTKELECPFDMIACCGAHIERDGVVIKDTPMGPELKETLEQINQKFHPFAYLLISKDHSLVIKKLKKGGYFFVLIYKLYWLLNFRIREHYDISKKIFDYEVENGKVYKIMVFFGLGKNKNKIAKEVNKLLRDNFPNIESSWSGIINELTPLNCNKGAGVKSYCEHFGVDPKDVYVIGDSGNDISMFNAYYDNSYVMQKAYPSVKKYAKHSVSGVHSLINKVLPKEKK